MHEPRRRSPVICLLGPTASGKTDLAVELVRRVRCEIISVDSAMIYRGMDIGTAKPGADVLRHAPHHLIDIRDPWESYSAGQFAADARGLIRAIHARGATPLLVGGTFLYFRALEQGLAPLPTADKELRAELDRRGETEGWPALHAELARVDPDAAARIDPNDRQRIQRALEVYRLSGEPISMLQRLPSSPSNFDFMTIVLEALERSALYRKIEQRLAAMLDDGFLAEVERLKGHPRMSGAPPRIVGYRQFWQYLEGQLDFAEAREKALIATRRYAKRQCTWLRGVSADLRLDYRSDTRLEGVLELLETRGIPAHS